MGIMTHVVYEKEIFPYPRIVLYCIEFIKKKKSYEYIIIIRTINNNLAPTRNYSFRNSKKLQIKYNKLLEISKTGKKTNERRLIDLCLDRLRIIDPSNPLSLSRERAIQNGGASIVAGLIKGQSISRYQPCINHRD